jgi:uncharacterized protein (TIGR02145 family)
LKKFLLSSSFCLLLSSLGWSQTLTNVGTDFWIAFPPNYSAGPPPPTLKIFISSNFATNGNVTSAYPGVNQAFTVTPGTVTQVVIPGGAALTTGIENKGIRVTANDPISVYGLNHYPATTDAYLGIPIASLGMDYRVMSYSSSSPNYTSQLSVVATQDGTTVTVFNHQTHVTSHINLDQGQTYLETAGTTTGTDITGSRIQSNYPVGVFGSVQCVNIPTALCGACDHIVEMMFPYYSWGKNYVTVPLAGRDNSGDVFRILSGTNATDVSINGAWVATIDSGVYYQTILTGYNSISTSNATLVCQFAKGQLCSGNITGDPFSMLILPEEQFLTNYTIINVSGLSLPVNSHWVNVVAPVNALGTILQDGVLIPNSAFTQISTTNFYGVQRLVTEGSHTFTSPSPFGVFVYGWGGTDSYGYPGGGSFSPVGTVDHITLLPDTSYGQLNVTNICLTATVTDNLSAPVSGVLVNFHVYGLNPLSGNAYTDAAGHAQYCYTQTGASAGTDHVYAELFGFTSDTAVVFWSYTPPCTNPTNGGTIGSDQSNCGSFTPAPLLNSLLPTGQTGTMEYKWQVSTTSNIAGFSDIPGNNTAFYSPGVITQTSWFKRMARVNCMTDWTGAAESNVVQITITTPLVVGISIAAPTYNVCAGTAVTFTATPINPGTTPFYQWKVNGINKGTNSDMFTFTPVNSDAVTCTLTSSESCTSNNPATSTQQVMTVNPNLPVTISVSTLQNPVCPGTLVTFTALPGNPGMAPLYQWQVNGVNAGTNSTSYSYVPLNGDLVNCTLTSSETCATNNPVSGVPVSMTVNTILPVSITISASANPVCSGNPVTFTALPNNQGTNPLYQWKVDGVNAGINAATFNYIPLTGDQVVCNLTSNIACPSGNPAASNTISMNVNPLPVVTFNLCTDSITTLNSRPFRLKGGIPLGGVYSGSGVNSSTGIFNPAVAGTGVKIITYTYTNIWSCLALAHATIFNYVQPPFNCGAILTDIRDNKAYHTVQIGSQCWMAEDLNYGTEIPTSQDQRDNCTAEKYTHTSQSITHSFYQWDELMQYSETPGDKGLCPPAWHVPLDAEWNTLFSAFINNGYAGSPLKYSGYSGFNALLSGVIHINKGWDFQEFATFFWSSDPMSNTKAWAHGMNDINPSVSFYPSLRSNAFSVRCIHD